LLVKLCCHPGRSVLTASGTVKDDFLILGEGRRLFPELGEGNSSVQLQASELLFTVIGADEQNLLGLDRQKWPTPHALWRY
jgi:hypothetical protein